VSVSEGTQIICFPTGRAVVMVPGIGECYWIPNYHKSN